MKYEKIGHFIVNLRKEKGLSQDELTKQMNYTSTNISKWERAVLVQVPMPY